MLMPLPPDTTPVPQPIFLPGMSPAQLTSESPPAPTATILPYRAGTGEEAAQGSSAESASSNNEAAPSRPADEFSQPRLRLQLHDLTDHGTSIFLSSISPSSLLPSAVKRVQEALYIHPASGYNIPSVRSVTLIVRSMDGVAYTTGIDLDPQQHKEIHFSTRYIASISAARRGHEIEGVIVHELVHCFQHNGRGHAPGGLIEGMADWVRLAAGLAPPHWKKGEELKGKWDAGYQHTAFFLQYLEERFGEGTVRRLNEGLRVSRYDEKIFWTGILGRPIEQLWEDYKKETELR